MFGLRHVKMKPKLMLVLLVVGVAPLVFVAWWATRSASNALTRNAYAALENDRDVKAKQIKRFFADRQGDMNVLLETVGALEHGATEKLKAIQQLKAAQVETLIQRFYEDVATLSESLDVRVAYKEFKAYHDKMKYSANDAINITSADYQNIYNKHNGFLANWSK